MSKLSIKLSAGVLAVALAVSGCGGDSDEAATATARQVSKATFIREADAVCKKAYARSQAGYLAFAEKNVGSNPFSSIEEIEEFVGTVLIPGKEKQVEELRAVGLPKGSEEQAEAIFAAYEEGIEKAEESPRDALTTTAGVFGKAKDLSERYGISSYCGA